MNYLTDSYSDGMCGWVELTDTDTGRKCSVSWAVDGVKRPRSQAKAIEEAERILRGTREGR